LPQSPQLSGSVCRSTQAVRVPPPPPPVGQASGVGAEQPVLEGWQAPAWHCSPTAQTFVCVCRLPQPPQSNGLDFVSTHWVPPPNPGQLVSPVRHPHWPALHTSVLLQACPHWPQSRRLVCRSTQLPPPQSVCPVPQPAHAPLVHVCPAVQSAPERHSTHRFAVASQYGRPCALLQFESAVHRTHACVVVLHAGRCGSVEQFPSPRHCTQTLFAVSQ
jgi:hypothetical protein